MDKQTLERELQSISILLREHMEWRLKYPEKFESVRQSAIGMFKMIIFQSTGINLPLWFKEIPVEDLKYPFYKSALRLTGKMKRILTKLETDAVASGSKCMYNKAARIWSLVGERLKEI